jgi:hypothetical protein
VLNIIKNRCYIVSSIYDDEIKSLISAAIIDCIESGIDNSVFKPSADGKYDDQVINCITAFVKANRGNDRTDTEVYMRMYTTYRDKMSLESNYNKVSDSNE